MNLDYLFVWAGVIAIAFAATGRLDVLKNWTLQAHAKVISSRRLFISKIVALKSVADAFKKLEGCSPVV